MAPRILTYVYFTTAFCLQALSFGGSNLYFWGNFALGNRICDYVSAVHFRPANLKHQGDEDNAELLGVCETTHLNINFTSLFECKKILCLVVRINKSPFTELAKYHL